MLGKLLDSLGINEDEAEVYFYLLENGPSTAGMLTKKVGIARTTLYGNLQGLTQKAVVKRTLKQGIRTFIAEPPEAIEKLFQTKIDQLASHKKKFSDIIPQLQAKMSKEFFNPIFQIYEGEKGVQNALRETVIYSDIETLSFWPVDSMANIAPKEFFNTLNKDRIKKNNHLRAIWPETYKKIKLKNYPFFGTGEYFKRKVRLAPKEVDFSMGYMIYADNVLFVSSRKEMFAFIVKSAELAALQRTLFEFIWNSSKELNIDVAETGKFFME